MNTDQTPKSHEPLTVAQQLEIDRVCAEFESVWQKSPSAPPDIQHWLDRLSKQLALPLFRELLSIDWEYRKRWSQAISTESLQKQFPQFAHEIVSIVQDSQSNAAESPSNAWLSNRMATQQSDQLRDYIRQLEQAPLGRLPKSLADWTTQQLELARNLDRTLAQTTLPQKLSTSPRLERLGDFRIIREIGRGGMGTVFEAEQLSLRRRVALKVLWFGAAYDAESVQRFEREATTIANLHHTNIVPIFAVGKQDEINYYAMQLIDGQSLDRLAKQASFTCDPAAVTDWGVQAAEALAHAHERGVIHRDIKPSNLMLDQSGRLWLTDFGLAKSDQDQSLSLAGVMLGTPRYMSPEQATTNLSRVDQRSDIYSLGATLFELLAGRPVFEGDSPIVLIQQILTEEPPALDRLRPEISRDLATVIMKCLRKDPRERYANARELLQDLRCVDEGRPIRARRTSTLELASKWLKRHQTSLRTTVVAMIALALVVFGLAVTWFTVQQYYTSRLELTSASTPITVEFFNEQHQLIHPAVTLPTHQPLQFDSQTIKLRVTADGVPSLDYRWDAVPQTQDAWKLELLEQSWQFPPSERSDFQFFKTANQNLIVSWTQDRLFIDVSGSLTSQPTFQTDEQALLLEQIAKSTRIKNVAPLGCDLDGDGVEEIIVAFSRTAAIYVVSRSKGMIWQQNFHSVDNNVTSPETPLASQALRGEVLQPPQLVPDQDNDGRRDLLVSIGQNPLESPADSTGTTRSLCLVSATGSLLWRTDFASEQFELPVGAIVAPTLQWHLADPYSTGSHSIGSFFTRNGRRLRHLERSQILEAPHLEAPQAAWLHIQGQDRVVVRTGTKLHLLELPNGRAVGNPLETNRVSTIPFQLHDLDGDQIEEVVLVEQLAPVPNPNPNAFVDSIPQSRLSVWSLGQQQPVWEKIIAAPSPQPSVFVDSPRWPIIAVAGETWMVIPQKTNRDVGYTGQSLPWSEIDFVHASTGEVRWTKRIPNTDSWTDQIAVIPDMDLDAIPEVVVASLWTAPWELVVECRAGGDGELLWLSRCPIDEQQTDEIESLRYLPAQRRVQANLSSPNKPRTAVHLSAETGQILQTISGFQHLNLLDVDGDQIDDWCVVKTGANQNSPTKKLQIVAGHFGEQWRRLGKPVQRGSDFDLDGFADLLAVSDDRVTAFATTNGSPIWTLEASQQWSECRAYTWESMGVVPRETWDFDRDGTLDIILQTVIIQAEPNPAVTAVSGRTGKVLWQSQPTRFQRANLPRLTFSDLDRDGRLDVLSCEPRPVEQNAAILPSTNPPVQSTSAFAIVRWEIGDQAATWIHDVGEKSNGASILTWDQAYDLSEFPRFRFVNVDDDEVMDCLVVQELVTAGETDNQLAIAAISGATGEILWAVPLGLFSFDQRAIAACDRFSTADLDNDGNNELLILSFDSRTTAAGDNQRIARLTAYDWRQGALRWQFEAVVADDFLTMGVNTLLRPFPIQASNGRILIALNLRNRDQRDVVVVVDANGNAYGEYPMKRRQNHYRDGFNCWVFDCDGDGQDEILFDDETLVALKTDPTLDVWLSFPISVAQDDVDLQLISTDPTHRQLVVTVAGTFSAIAFDSKSAEPRWRVNGPQSNRQYHSDRVSVQVIASEWADASQIATKSLWVVCNGFLDCTTVTAIDLPSHDTTDADIARHRRFVSAANNSVVDFRWQRPLPWSSENIEKNLLSGPGEMATFVGFVMFASGLVVWLPWGIWQAMRRRWISHLGALLLLSLCAAVDGLFLGQNFSIPFLFERPGWMAKLTLAFQYAPLWLVIVGIPYWIWQGSWRSLGGWLVVALLSSVLIGGLEVFTDLQNAPLAVGEYYAFSWSPLILGYGLFAASWLGVMVWGAKWIFSGFTFVLERWLGNNSNLVGWLRGWQKPRSVIGPNLQRPTSSRYVQTLYLWATLGWTCWLLICPTWQGVIYWIDSSSPQFSAVVGGSFALNSTEPCFVWDPPLAAGISGVAIRWPGQPISQNKHIEIDIHNTLFRFVCGMLTIGLILMIGGSLIPRERNDPAWLQVATKTLLWAIVCFATLSLQLLTQGELPGARGLAWMVVVSLVLGYLLSRWIVGMPLAANRKLS